MATRHMKRCLTLLIIKKQQIKATIRYHLPPVRMAILKKSTNKKSWRGCGVKGTLLHCWWECKLVQPLWRTVWRFLKKLEIELQSVQFSRSVMSNSLRPRESQHARPPCPSPTFTQTHVHQVGNAIQPSHPLSSPSPAFSLSQHQGLSQ